MLLDPHPVFSNNAHLLQTELGSELLPSSSPHRERSVNQALAHGHAWRRSRPEAVTLGKRPQTFRGEARLRGR